MRITLKKATSAGLQNVSKLTEGIRDFAIGGSAKAAGSNRSQSQSSNASQAEQSNNELAGDDDEHSSNEALDSLPNLTHAMSRQSRAYSDNDETIEFVDMASPVNKTNRRRKRSSLVRKFSVGSLADSVKIDIGDSESINEQVVYDAHTDDSIYDPKVSDFEPITVLGQGAYGKVLLVRHKATDKLFAQKQLKKALILVSARNRSSLINEEASKLEVDKKVERTMAERDILSKISNQFIVKLFYALQDHSKIYLFLEFVPGGELFHHLNSSNFLDEKATSFYAAEMTLALLHLHEIGVVYRDLKPENCLLDSSGHLILTDFGLSKVSAEQDAKCSSIIGTPEYMAPEVLRGEDYGFSVDWWSLGAVVFDMLSGKPPFTGNNHKVISDKILKNKIKYPFYFTVEAKELLNKLLNKNPSKRMNVDSNFEKFKKLRFFRHINWAILQDDAKYREVKAPIVPIITNPRLAENFDDEFTNMKISNYDNPATTEELKQDVDQEMFKGFSYTASSSYIKRYL